MPPPLPGALRVAPVTWCDAWIGTRTVVRARVVWPSDEAYREPGGGGMPFGCVGEAAMFLSPVRPCARALVRSCARALVYLYGQPVDMRESFDGLYAMARSTRARGVVVLRRR